MGVAQFFVPEWDEIENKRDHRSIGCLGKQCKKMYSDTKKPPFYNKVIYPWTYPMLHKAKRWYVDFYILDPASNQMRRKKYMLSRYKTSKARIAMAREKIRWIVEAKAAPTALRPRATCPTCLSGICNDVLPPFVATDRPIVTLPPHRRTHPHPRSWLLWEHEKPWPVRVGADALSVKRDAELKRQRSN